MSAEPTHVDRLIPQIALDALAIGEKVGRLAKLLDDAAAHRVYRRHTNAATLEQAARAELRQLAAALDYHFRRFVEHGGSCYRCTCGYELRGAELDDYLRTLRGPLPVSITCKRCGGVAVRMSGA